MSADPSRAGHDPDRLLGTYLRDHLAGAATGLSLVGRCREANRENRVGDALGDIEAEIAEDRQALIRVMERLDVSPNPLKTFAAKAAALLGRVKTNGTLTRYSPSSRVVELEGLLAGVTAKRALWRTLLQACASRPELDAASLERLIAQATSQLDRLTAEHGWATAVAFDRSPSP